MILSIFLFFVLIFLYGLSLKIMFRLYFPKTFVEVIMILGLGLGILPIILVVAHTVFGAPIVLWLFISIGAIIPIGHLIKNMKIKPTYYFNSMIENWPVMLIVLLTFSVMVYGSLQYPYLEDDDPWGHAIASKFISETKSAVEPEYLDFHYIDPYPPSYDMIMGMVHQKNNSINLTLKVMNIIFICLGLLFFYVFCLNLTGSNFISTIATFILSMIPSYMSHFIWSQTLAVIIIFPTFYAIGRIDKNWMWVFPSSLMIASMMVIQPSTTIVFIGMYGLYWFARVWNKGFLSSVDLIFTFISGVFISFFGYWFFMILKYGFRGTLEGIGFVSGMVQDVNYDTSGGKIYSLMDFLFPPMLSRMDQAIGIGVVVCLLVVLFYTIYRFKKFRKNVDGFTVGLCFLWIIFTFFGVQGNAFPIKLMPHRFWVFLSIPVAIISACMFVFIVELVVSKVKEEKKKLAKILITSILILLIFLTSGIPRIATQVSQWRQGVGISDVELDGYNYLTNFEKGTRVFIYSKGFDRYAIGYDMYSCEWCASVNKFRKTIPQTTYTRLNNFLHNNGYKYLFISKIQYNSIETDYVSLRKNYDIEYEDNWVIIFKVM